MRQLADYLVLLGHKNMVMISGRTCSNDRQQSRVRAFREAVAQAGITKTCHVIERPYSLVEGAAAMRSIYAEYPTTTAVMCASDVLAFGVMSECKKLKINVSGDLTVSCFDNQDFTALLDPPLTAVDVPAVEMGNRSAESLLAAMGSHRKIESVRLETNLIIRSSPGSVRSH
jgi:LacI family transcriptional regulator